jgi:hypothetical protein
MHYTKYDLRSVFYILNIGSSKENAEIIETYRSKTVKYIEMVQVSKCGERTLVLDMLC